MAISHSSTLSIHPSQAVGNASLIAGPDILCVNQDPCKRSAITGQKHDQGCSQLLQDVLTSASQDSHRNKLEKLKLALGNASDSELSSALTGLQPTGLTSICQTVLKSITGPSRDPKAINTAKGVLEHLVRGLSEADTLKLYNVFQSDAVCHATLCTAVLNTAKTAQKLVILRQLANRGDPLPNLPAAMVVGGAKVALTREVVSGFANLS
jgi:hypothetical protein